MTIKVHLTIDGRKLKQDFGGCVDIEEGRLKARKQFPGCKITKAEEVVEKKK